MRAGASALTITLAAAALAAAAPAPPKGAPIIVDIVGVRIPGGSVRVDVCTRETFLKATCPYAGSAAAQLGTTRVMVNDVPAGTYAIQAFHDINDNGRVDRNHLGFPTEGIAFSNDAPLGLHGPSFTHAAFVHDDAPQTLKLDIKHFRRIENGVPKE